MSTWNGSFEASPADSQSPSQGDDRIRELKTDIRSRIENEHISYNDSQSSGAVANDWIHKAGSAHAWYQAAAPTTYPNGNALDADAAGRLWIDSDDDRAYVYNGSSFVSPKAAASIFVQAHVPGVLSTGTDVVPKIVFPGAFTITAIYVVVDTAPTGSGIRLGFNKNGTDDILGTATYIQIDATNTSANETSDFDGTNAVFAAGDYLTIDIDQIGSTNAGTGLHIGILGAG